MGPAQGRLQAARALTEAPDLCNLKSHTGFFWLIQGLSLLRNEEQVALCFGRWGLYTVVSVCWGTARWIPFVKGKERSPDILTNSWFFKRDWILHSVKVRGRIKIFFFPILSIKAYRKFSIKSPFSHPHKGICIYMLPRSGSPWFHHLVFPTVRAGVMMHKFNQPWFFLP